VNDIDVRWGDEGMYDNRWIVSYNPYLIRRYKAHINVEVYITIQAIKYIHKYVYKGRDKATLEIADTDKIRRYVTCRYIGSSQIVWDLLQFFMYAEYPDITRLPLYLFSE
jgi:hypothetical protein